VRILTGHTHGVMACAWAPDGSALVTTSEDKTVRVWSAGDWSCLRTLTAHGAEVVACAWAPDGSAFATASYDQTVLIWSDV
jgi:WD40 repeat protein